MLRGRSADGAPWDLEVHIEGALRPWLPEGWLGRLWRTGLLPCRYLVHTLCTPARYALSAPGGLGERGSPLSLAGDGTAHVETNFGESFPDGWIYAQGHASASDGEGPVFVLTGGRFRIGPVAPLTWLLCLRLPGLPPLDFRTTDLDVVQVRRLSFAEKEVALEARRPLWRGGPRVSLRLRAPAGSFGREGLYVPTPGGFARTPGAAESFSAVADLRVSGVNGGAGSCFSLQGCVLEFGGAFQDQRELTALESQIGRAHV